MRAFLSFIYFCFSIVFLLFSAEQTQSAERVFVSILPQKFFVQQISGDSLEVHVMVQPGANPATYEPRPSQMKKLAKSAAYFAIGVPYEQVWLKKIAGINPSMLIVHTDDDIEKVAMAPHSGIKKQHSSSNEDNDHDEAHKDSNDHNENHDHTGLDPHIWLSPILVKKQVAIITRSLQKLFPEKAHYFQANSDQFLLKIDSLHKELETLLKNNEGKQFIVFHPSWGYFAKEYGLKQVPIEIQGKNPKPAQVKEIIEYAKRHNIHVIFTQRQFSAKHAKIIAREIGGKVVPVDPLAERWVENLRETAHKIKSAIQ